METTNNTPNPAAYGNTEKQIADLLSGEPILKKTNEGKLSLKDKIKKRGGTNDGKQVAADVDTDEENNSSSDEGHARSSDGDDKGTARKSDDEDGENENESDDDDNIDADDGESLGEERLSLADLAESLGVELSELYDIEIPIANGTVKLSDMKDDYVRLKKMEADFDDIVIERQNMRNERAEATQTLSRMASLLPPQAKTPEFLQQVKAYTNAIQRVENEKLLQAFPEWADPKTFQAARQAVLKAVKPYGLTEYDLNTILDSRWVRTLHDFAELKERLSKVNTFGKQVRQSAKKVGTSKKPKSGFQSTKNRGTRGAEATQRIANLLTS